MHGSSISHFLLPSSVKNSRILTLEDLSISSLIPHPRKMSNPFYDEEEVDDDAFLSHPKSGRSGYMLPQNNASSRQQGGSSSSAAVEESRRQLMLKKQDIERRTLESSGRSLGYLYESEQVGVATAEELARQKEQLKNTESRLDEINSTLNRSERHLTGWSNMYNL